MNKNPVEPTPENFENYDQAADFWDSHDTTDYLDEFRTVEATSHLQARHFEVEVEEDVLKALQDKARQQGVPVGHLASDLLRQQLKTAA